MANVKRPFQPVWKGRLLCNYPDLVGWKTYGVQDLINPLFCDDFLTTISINNLFLVMLLCNFTGVKKANTMSKQWVSRPAVMRLAWRLYRENKRQLAFGACMVAAWKVLRLNAALQHGLVRFSFQKLNGEVREAVGTLRSDLFVVPPKTTDRPEFLTVVRYFDLDKNAIRSFRAERILRVA